MSKNEAALGTAPGDDNSSTMIHVDAHRAFFYAQASSNTYLEVTDVTKRGKPRCGRCLGKATYGTRQAASDWQNL